MHCNLYHILELLASVYTYTKYCMQEEVKSIFKLLMIFHEDNKSQCFLGLQMLGYLGPIYTLLVFSCKHQYK